MNRLPTALFAAGACTMLAAAIPIAAADPSYLVMEPTQAGAEWTHPNLPGMRLVRFYPGPDDHSKYREICTVLAKGEAGQPVRAEDIVAMSCQPTGLKAW